MRQRTRQTALSLALAGLLAAGAPATAEAQANGVILDEPVEIPSFALEDQYGREYTQESLRDQWTLVMLGFTTCPDVCPFTLANLEAVIAETSMRVSPSSLPRVLFLSVDPDRDRENLSDYARHFHPDFIGITGDREDIDRIVEATDSFYRFVEKGDTYEVQHSASVSIIGPEGKLRAKIQPPFDPGPTAEFLARLQIEYRREMTQ